MEQAEVGWDDVARICVGTGPGGFTGLRLGVSTARALSQSHDLPIVGVSSLEALARGVELASANELDLPGHPEVSGPVLAVIDARRGEVFAAIYRHHRTTMQPGVFAPGELADRVAGRREWGRSPMLGVGDGAIRFRAELERAGVAVPSDSSRAPRGGAPLGGRLGRGGGAAGPGAPPPGFLGRPAPGPPHPPNCKTPRQQPPRAAG